MINIRKFLPKDLKQVLKISRLSFSEPWPQKEFEKFYNSEGFIVAEENGAIAGFAVAKISDNKGFLKLIAVNPDYRRRSVGRDLMEKVFNYFEKNGVKKILAHSRIHNEAGCAFLKSFSFKKIKMIDNYYSDGDDAYLMKKESQGDG